jgi:predicted deacetylase
MKIAIEYDDFSPTNPAVLPAIEVLHNIREHYEGFKVTMFTIPWECRFGKTISLVHEECKPFVKVMKKMYDDGWMQYALHGLTHIGPSEENPHTAPEFANLTYDSAYKRIKGGKDIFELIDVPLLPIFKAPNWAISQEGEQAVKDHGLQLVKDRYYHWNLKDPMPKQTEFGDKIVIAHGHVQNDVCRNGIQETSHKLMNLPEGTEFYFLDKAI